MMHPSTLEICEKVSTHLTKIVFDYACKGQISALVANDDECKKAEDLIELLTIVCLNKDVFSLEQWTAVVYAKILYRSMI